MTRTVLLVCAAISLGFPSGAGAKGLTSVRACGPEERVLIGDLAAIRGLVPFEAPPVWPAAVETPAEGPTPDGGNWMAYVQAPALILLPLAAFALVVRRLRIRRPRTA